MNFLKKLFGIDIKEPKLVNENEVFYAGHGLYFITGRRVWKENGNSKEATAYFTSYRKIPTNLRELDELCHEAIEEFGRIFECQKEECIVTSIQPINTDTAKFIVGYQPKKK